MPQSPQRQDIRQPSTPFIPVAFHALEGRPLRTAVLFQVQDQAPSLGADVMNEGFQQILGLIQTPGNKQHTLPRRIFPILIAVSNNIHYDP